MSNSTQAKRASAAVAAVDTGPAGHETAAEERQFAAQTWLLIAAKDGPAAQLDWHSADVTLLRCGTLFTAIRVPLPLIEAAAGTNDREKIGAYLNAVLFRGAAFLDKPSENVYFLVPQSTWGRWVEPETECLSPDMRLGVPRPGAKPDERAYWLVEMDGPGDLCARDAVKALVEYGRLRAVQADG
ncbi:hypothetical protein ABZ499_27760 [Streptomyces sp. NPDC019990]|uniref:hypothetical protein n=1 Tax=Streptomyces sp. NPDC019990 TaxID=3154693 RepID=UPI0033CD6A3A